MQTEIEAKFANVDFTKIRQQLEVLGAACRQPMRHMRRAIIETPQLREKHGFVRVRDEGDKVTLTYKQVDENSLTGVKEIEVTVSDFENTVALLEQANLPYKSFQESRRETWHLDDVEVVLDEWPHLNPYIEIEGPTEDLVKEVAKKLGFDWKDAIFGRTTELYQLQYPNGNADKLVTIPRHTFDQPLSKIISG
jgi:adenylate cyclase, class 2